MKLDISQKEIEYYNSNADELLLLLKPAPELQDRKNDKIPSSSSHIFVQEISDEHILSFNATGTINGFGEQLSKYFILNGKSIGLREGDFPKCKKLIKTISKNKNLNKYLSEEYLLDILFQWFKKRYTGEIAQSVQFFSFLIEQSKSQIKKRKIDIPISYLSIQDPFKLGNVTFDFFTQDFIDNLIKQIEKNAKKSKVDEATINEYSKKMRKEYQGSVISTIEYTAETNKCIEVAIQETEKALMILRCFSPTAFIPIIPSYFSRKGQREIPHNDIFVYEGKLPIHKKQIDEKKKFDWPISNKEIKQLMNIGLAEASQLIIKKNPTKLENLLLNSMFLFSKAITSTDFQNKVVFTLVSIETMLIQNSSEPIQSNVSQRLAFLTASDFQSRKEVIKTLKDAYSLRSSYLHHGEFKEDYKILQDIQHLVWTGLGNILKSRDQFKSQSDLLGYIEKLILS